jgi:hypothetical protein
MAGRTAEDIIARNDHLQRNVERANRRSIGEVDVEADEIDPFLGSTPGPGFQPGAGSQTSTPHPIPRPQFLFPNSQINHDIGQLYSLAQKSPGAFAAAVKLAIKGSSSNPRSLSEPPREDSNPFFVESRVVFKVADEQAHDDSTTIIPNVVWRSAFAGIHLSLRILTSENLKNMGDNPASIVMKKGQDRLLSKIVYLD